MGDVWISNLEHYLDSDGELVERHRKAFLFGKFLASIVQARTGMCDWGDSNIDIKCRRRPGRKPCPGKLEALFDPNFIIIWRCPVCDDRGVIDGWHGTKWDKLSNGAKSAPMTQVQKVIAKLIDYCQDKNFTPAELVTDVITGIISFEHPSAKMLFRSSEKHVFEGMEEIHEYTAVMNELNNCMVEFFSPEDIDTWDSNVDFLFESLIVNYENPHEFMEGLQKLTATCKLELKQYENYSALEKYANTLDLYRKMIQPYEDEFEQALERARKPIVKQDADTIAFYQTGYEMSAAVLLFCQYIDQLRRITFNQRMNVIRKKIGRNDLCPCGSGKKYKKCCLN